MSQRPTNNNKTASHQHDDIAAQKQCTEQQKCSQQKQNCSQDELNQNRTCDKQRLSSCPDAIVNDSHFTDASKVSTNASNLGHHYKTESHNDDDHHHKIQHQNTTATHQHQNNNNNASCAKNCDKAHQHDQQCQRSEQCSHSIPAHNTKVASSKQLKQNAVDGIDQEHQVGATTSNDKKNIPHHRANDERQ